MITFYVLHEPRHAKSSILHIRKKNGAGQLPVVVCYRQQKQGVQNRMVLVVNFFEFMIFFLFVVAICDFVHDVEIIHGLY